MQGISPIYPAHRKKWKGVGVQNGADCHSVKSEFSGVKIDISSKKVKEVDNVGKS